MSPRLRTRALAEALGTAFLVAIVVGSGIMAERLAAGAVGLALLVNSLATGFGLFAVVLVFAPISGAHLNPAVTLASAANGTLPRREAPAYVIAQLAGGVAGVAAAHAMFGAPLLALGRTARTGGGLWLGEGVATLGLTLVVFATAVYRSVPVSAAAIGAYIASAYWFTSSTSFANPAVTLARALTDTFAGIRPADALPFAACQLAGAFLGAGIVRAFGAAVRSGDA